MHWIKEVMIAKSIDEFYDRFWREQISQYKDSQIYLLSICLQNDDVQDFHVGWDQALLSASEIPTDVILDGLCK